MKLVKSVVAVILTVAMLMSMTVTVFAETFADAAAAGNISLGVNTIELTPAEAAAGATKNLYIYSDKDVKIGAVQFNWELSANAGGNVTIGTPTTFTYNPYMGESAAVSKDGISFSAATAMAIGQIGLNETGANSAVPGKVGTEVYVIAVVPVTFAANTAPGAYTLNFTKIVLKDGNANFYKENGVDINYIANSAPYPLSAKMSVTAYVPSEISITGVTAPAKGGDVTTAISCEQSQAVETAIGWYANGASYTEDTFGANTVYTANITVTAREGYIFNGTPTFKVDGAAWDCQPMDDYFVLSKTFPATGSADALTGTVVIDNTNPQFGQSLVATPTLNYGSEAGPGNGGELSFQWYRGTEVISGANTNTYKVVKEDIGKTLKVEVSNSNNSGSVFSEATAAVEKADNNTTATNVSQFTKTDTTITVLTVSNQEYAIAEKTGDVDPATPTEGWNTTGEFTELKRNTTYVVFTRKAATETYKAGTDVKTVTITTEKTDIAGLLTVENQSKDYAAVGVDAAISTDLTTNDYEVVYTAKSSAASLDSADKPLTAGEYTVTVNGMGDYKGQKTATLTITPYEVTITPKADTCTKEYGETDPVLTYTHNVPAGALAEVFAPTGALAREAGEDYGNYDITIGTLAAGANFKLTVADVDFTITKVKLSGATVEAVDNVTYTGNAYTPKPEVTLKGKTLKEGTDFTYSYENNTNAGTATVTITAVENGNYHGTKSVDFIIDKAKVTVPTIASQVYTGEKLIADVAPDDLYTVVNEGGTDVGAYDVVLTLVAPENYKWADDTTTAAKTLKFEITEATNKWTNTSPLTIAGWAYGDDANAPVAPSTFGTATFTYSTAVDGEYTEAVPTNAGTYYVKAEVAANGDNYKAITTGPVSFTIAQVDYSAAASFKTQQTVIVGKGAFVEPTFVGANSEAVAGTTVYSIENQSNLTYDQVVEILKTKAVNATAEVGYSFTTTNPNYVATAKTGTINVTVKDIEFKVDDDTATAANGVTIKTAPTYGDTWAEIVTIGNIKAYLDGQPKEGEFSLNVSGKPDASENLPYSVLFNGSGYTNVEVFSGTVTVAPKAVTDAEFEAIANVTYNGDEQKPEPKVTLGGVELVKGTDFDFSYENNTAAGTTATVKITGKGNYTGEASKNFTIAPKSVSEAVFGAITEQTYSGEAITPTPTVAVDGKTLVAGTDFTFSYEKNVDAGTAAKVKITGKGNYTGEASTTFTIKAADLSGATVGDVAAREYTGEAIKPTPTVTVAGKTLTAGKDFTYDYTNNTNVGEATITITGVGNYTGNVIKKFNITAKNVADAVFSDIANVTYNGAEQKPEFTVKVDGNLLKSTDYTVVYDKNIVAGEAEITITGVGNYTGTAKTTFTIDKKEVTITGVTAKDKDFDGNDTAEIDTTNAAISGKVESDDLAIVAGTATFASEEIGESIKVTFSGFALTGTDAANYVLKAQPADVTADIKKPTTTIVVGSGVVAGHKVELNDFNSETQTKFTTDPENDTPATILERIENAMKKEASQAVGGNNNLTVTLDIETEAEQVFIPFSEEFTSTSRTKVNLVKMNADGTIEAVPAEDITIKKHGIIVNVDGADSNGVYALAWRTRKSSGSSSSSGNTIESPRTFDAGMALYAGMALSSAMGAAYVMRKKKED